MRGASSAPHDSTVCVFLRLTRDKVLVSCLVLKRVADSASLVRALNDCSSLGNVGNNETQESTGAGPIFIGQIANAFLSSSPGVRYSTDDPADS